MPAFETMDRYQPAVLWEPVGKTRNNEPIFGDPVELRVRWDDVQNEVLDPQGNSITTDITIVSDRIMVIGSVLYQGELSDWTGTGSALEPEGLFEVVTNDKTPDLKNRNKRYTQRLIRFKDELRRS